MMWLAADAKVFSPPTLWPDFTVEMFRQALTDFSKTPRRFGA
jgi:undecaprenyl diphosphate synthase